MGIPNCRRVRLYRQLDGTGNSSENCGVSATRSLITHASRGLLRPSAKQVRRRMEQLTGMTNPIDARKAIHSYDQRAQQLGLKPLRFRLAGKYKNGLFTEGAPRERLRAGIKNEDLIYVVVDYALVNDLFKDISGADFRGLHAWAVGGINGWRRAGNELEVRVLDALWDGRRPGIPLGPQWVTLSDIWTVADGAWSTKGSKGWVGGLVACSKPLVAPAPEVETDEYEELVTEIAELESQLAEREQALAEARALIETLSAGDAPSSLANQLRDLADELETALEPNTSHANEDPSPGLSIDEA